MSSTNLRGARIQDFGCRIKLLANILHWLVIIELLCLGKARISGLVEVVAVGRAHVSQCNEVFVHDARSVHQLH